MRKFIFFKFLKLTHDKTRGDLHDSVAICFSISRLSAQVVAKLTQLIRNLRILSILRSGTYQLINIDLIKINSPLLSDVEAMKNECTLRFFPDHICTGCKDNLGSECA